MMDGAEACRVQASGMAAMTAAMLCQLSQGDHVVAARAAFGSCRWLVDSLLPRFGITSTTIDARDNAQWEAAIQPNTKVFFFETPANPTMKLCDIEALATLAHDCRRTELFQGELFAALQIIARGEAPTTEGKLRHAGADRVVLPTHIGAERIAEMILYDAGSSLIRDSAAMQDSERLLQSMGLEFEMLTVPVGGALTGALVAEAQVATFREVFLAAAFVMLVAAALTLLAATLPVLALVAAGLDCLQGTPAPSPA